MRVTLPTRLGRLGVRVAEGPEETAVLWHGFFADSHSWDRVLPVLTQLRTVVLIDGPSFGDSEPLRRPSTIDECALAAFDVLDALGIDRADWVGNGWGGQVGMLAAAQEPRRIRSLVAFGSPTRVLTGRERRYLSWSLPIIRAVGFTAGLRRLALRSLLTARTIAVDAEAVRIVTHAFASTDRRGFVQAARSFVLDRPSLEPAALRVEAPTVFVAGDSREGWGPDEAQALSDRMLNARTRILYGVRNIAPLEDPDAVAGMVREHWAANARR